MLPYLVGCFAIASGVCVLIIIVAVCSHDYSKDDCEKERKKYNDGYDEFLLKP